MARRKKPRAPARVALDRLDEKHASGLALDDEGQPLEPPVRWKVRGAPVGAIVEAQPGRKQTARRRALLHPAPNQIPPACPVFGTCGGCQLQEMPLDRQRAEKSDLLRRLVGLGPDDRARAHAVVGAPSAYGYRNKLELSWGTRRFVPESALGPEGVAGIDLDGSFLGFHPPGWFGRIVPISGCPLGTPAMNTVIERVAGLGLAPAWSAHSHEGIFRHLVLRDAGTPEQPQVLVTLVTTTEATREQVAPVEQALADLPWVRGLLWVVTDRLSEVAQGELRAVLAGRADLDFSLAGVPLRLPHDAFFQVNTAGANVLVQTVRRALLLDAPTDATLGTLLDLYCGCGALGLALAEGFDRLVGIELHAGAIDQATANASALGVAGEWHAGKVEDVLPSLTLDRPLRAVVDPPRAGLHPKAARFLAALEADVLVYVSCGPKHLGRDRAVLEAGGWRLTDLWGVDLFPQTHHTEAVARFVR